TSKLCVVTDRIERVVGAYLRAPKVEASIDRHQLQGTAQSIHRPPTPRLHICSSGALLRREDCLSKNTCQVVPHFGGVGWMIECKLGVRYGLAPFPQRNTSEPSPDADVGDIGPGPKRALEVRQGQSSRAKEVVSPTPQCQRFRVRTPAHGEGEVVQRLFELSSLEEGKAPS